MPVNTNAWNRIRYTVMAPIYDTFVSAVLRSFGTQRRRAVELLALRPGERVLIVGAGTGLDLPYIPAGVSITAVDITPAMLTRLEHRAARLGRRVEARVMDGQNLSLAPDSFDAVILNLIVAVIPDPVACLREAARVLKPGGRAVVFDKFVPDESRPSMVRRMLNLVTNLVVTDITRRLGPIVQAAPLTFSHREPAGWGGVFQIALLAKEAGAAAANIG